MQFSVSGLLKPFERLLQGLLFPTLEQQLGPVSDKHRQLVEILGLAEIESLVAPWMGGVGRPAKHDSQVATPLAEMTARRVTNLYDLMDSAYDAAAI